MDGIEIASACGDDDEEEKIAFNLRYDEIPRRKRSDCRNVVNETDEDITDDIDKNRGNSGEISREEASSENSHAKSREYLEVAAFFDSTHCQLCQKNFRFHSRYKSHYIENHPGKDPYACPYCPGSFSRRAGAYNHVIARHPDKFVRNEENRIVRCDIRGRVRHKEEKIVPSRRHCGMKFRHKADLDAHAKSCQGWGRWRGRQRRPGHRNSAKRGPAVKRCHYCRYKFGNVKNKKVHEIDCRVRYMKQRGGENHRVGMEELKKEVEEASALVSLSKRCNECDITFDYITNYEEHCLRRHPKKKVFLCEYCCSRFTLVKNLKAHVNRFHPTLDNAGPKRQAKKRIFSCALCRQNLNGIRDYESHYSAHHPGEKMFFCKNCRGSFFRKCSLDRHVKQVHIRARFSCQACGRIYATNELFKNHAMACRKLRTDGEWCEEQQTLWAEDDDDDDGKREKIVGGGNVGIGAAALPPKLKFKIKWRELLQKHFRNGQYTGDYFLS